MRSIKLSFILLLSLSMLAAACGGSDDDTSTGDTSNDASASSDETPVDTADAASDDTSESAEQADSNCAATSGSFETTDGATTLTATDAIAGSLLDGQAYTIYLADRSLSEDELGIISVPSPADGEVIVAVAITTFNADGAVDPVVPGEVVEYTSDFGVRTFVVTADLSGGAFLGDSTDASGTITITSIDRSICGEVTYRDGEKTLNAVFDAPIVDV